MLYIRCYTLVAFKDPSVSCKCQSWLKLSFFSFGSVSICLVTLRSTNCNKHQQSVSLCFLQIFPLVAGFGGILFRAAHCVPCDTQFNQGPVTIKPLGIHLLIMISVSAEWNQILLSDFAQCLLILTWVFLRVLFNSCVIVRVILA